MSKTIQDYLGSQATYSSGTLSVNISELYGIIFPDKTAPYELQGTDDEALAILLGALNKTARPEQDENGLEVQDSQQAITSSESFQGRIFEVRGEVSQIKHEFVFNVYTEDTTNFDPAKAV